MTEAEQVIVTRIAKDKWKVVVRTKDKVLNSYTLNEPFVAATVKRNIKNMKVAA